MNNRALTPIKGNINQTNDKKRASHDGTNL
jgi:hypothetical protein